MDETNSALPYKDTKPQGAPDFYFGINATFRFIEGKLGREAWIEYLRHLGRDYFRPVNDAWREGGFPAIAAYWKAFFDAEPGSDVVVHERLEEVEIEVRQCPAIKHLKEHKRQIFPSYCSHCYHLGSTRAQEAGYEMRLKGGDGSCRHFYKRAGEMPPQDFNDIKEPTSC